MQLDIRKLSHTMSHALRHAPEQYELTLDDQGWTSVEDLLIALRKRRSEWSELQAEDFVTVIANSNKQRYEIKDGGIRALYGHSTAEKLTRSPVAPPAVLYHGTTPQAEFTFRRDGLKPMKRQYVHLSADQDTAIQVARRHTNKPVIL